EGGGQGLVGVPSVGGDDEGVVPVQADSRESVRDRGDGRDDVRRDPAGAQGADDAEEAGVAGGQHGGGANASGDEVEDVVQVLEFSSFCVRRDGGYPQVTGRADDQPCAGQGAGRVGAERAAVAADHRDVLVSGGTTPPNSVAHVAHAAASAIFRWPV